MTLKIPCGNRTGERIVVTPSESTRFDNLAPSLELISATSGGGDLNLPKRKQRNGTSNVLKWKVCLFPQHK